jgi:hypothetical protein
MTIKLHALYLISLCLLLFSCGDNTVATYNIETGYIQPLAIGNYWAYTYDTSGVVYLIDTLKVTNYLDFHGNPVYALRYSVIGSPSVLSYYNNRSNGLWYYGYFRASDSTEYYNPKIHIKYPVSVNDIFVGDMDSVKCISVDAEFNGYTGCIKYEFLNVIDNYYSYWKPNVGLIGVELYSGGKLIQIKLTGYNLR